MGNQAIYFVIVFVIILLAYIFFIAILSKKLHERIPRNIYSPIERLIIFGILLGIFGMFQPWIQLAYQYGFSLLLFSTLTFIVWSHITPRPLQKSDIEKMIHKSHKE